MIVANIIEDKGGDVATVRGDAVVRDAVDMLSARNIGAVVVLKGSKDVCGIFSERDIVRLLDEQGAAALDQKISSVMTETVYSCSMKDTVHHLMSLMTTKRIRHLPVIEKGELLGIVSIGDVVKRRIEETEREAEELKSYITA